MASSGKGKRTGGKKSTGTAKRQRPRRRKRLAKKSAAEEAGCEARKAARGRPCSHRARRVSDDIGS